MEQRYHSGIEAIIDEFNVETVRGLSTVVFNVRCRSLRSGLEWSVPRRFSEFRDNFVAMQQLHPTSPVFDFPFPRRTLLPLSGRLKADERRTTLNKYLELLLQITPPPMIVAQFLRITPERYAKKKPDAAEESHVSSTRERSDTYGENDAQQASFPSYPMSPESGGGSLRDSAEDELDETSSIVSGTPDSTLAKQTREPPGESADATSTRTTTATALPPRAYSLKVVDDDLKDDEQDDHHDSHLHGLHPRVIVAILVTLASICSCRLFLMLFWLMVQGDGLTLMGLVNYIVDAIVRRKEDVFLVVKTVVFLVVSGIYCHRVLGFALGVYLRSILSTPKGGFLMYFDWISLRIGFDHNEIVVHGFEWRNPPKYQVERSRYFLRIRKLSVQFDLRSLLDSILQREDAVGNKHSLQVKAIEIDGLDVRIERGKRKKDGLNLWAALGADNDKKADEVQAGVRAGMAQAAKDVGEGLAVAGHAMEEGLQKAGGAVVGGIKTVGKGILKYNPVSVLARALDKNGNGNAKSELDSTVDEQPLAEGDNFHDVGQDDDYDEDQEMEENAANASGGGDGDGDATWHEGGEEQQPSNASTVEAAAAQSQSQSQSQSQKMRSGFFGRSSSVVDAPPPPPPKSSAWGVPFKIECNRFTGRELEFHVQDYLNASHVEDRPIIIPLMDMHRRELTSRGRVDKVKNPKGYRQPVWLDDLTWKIVNRLIADLLKTNSLSLMATVAASGANNAVSGIVEGSHIASVGAVEGLYSYNPKDLLAGVGRGISRLASSTRVSLAVSLFLL